MEFDVTYVLTNSPGSTTLKMFANAIQASNFGSIAIDLINMFSIEDKQAALEVPYLLIKLSEVTNLGDVFAIVID